MNSLYLFLLLRVRKFLFRNYFFVGNQGETWAKIEVSMQELLAEHRKENSSKSLGPDGIHPLRALKQLKSNTAKQNNK